jgi:hypothetical protein
MSIQSSTTNTAQYDIEYEDVLAAARWAAIVSGQKNSVFVIGTGAMDAIFRKNTDNKFKIKNAESEILFISEIIYPLFNNLLRLIKDKKTNDPEILYYIDKSPNVGEIKQIPHNVKDRKTITKFIYEETKKYFVSMNIDNPLTSRFISAIPSTQIDVNELWEPDEISTFWSDKSGCENEDVAAFILMISSINREFKTKFVYEKKELEKIIKLCEQSSFKKYNSKIEEIIKNLTGDKIENV